MICVGCLALILLLRPSETSTLLESDYLSESVLFVNCDLMIRYLDISTESRFRIGPQLFFDFIPSFPGAPMAVDGDSLYVGVNNILYEFDSSFDIRRQVCISEFGFEPSAARFDGHAYASERMLWITVENWVGIDQPPCFFVIQWDTTSPPDTRRISPEYSFHRRWAVDVKSNTLYVPSAKDPDTLCYSFDTGQVEYKAYGIYSNADIQNNMLLLSAELRSARLRNYPIVLIDLDTDECTFLDTGAVARWGSGGMIYYSKGTTHLWQMDIADRQPKALYRATRFPSYWLPSYRLFPFRLRMADIEVSESGRYLSFVYAKPKWLLIDQWSFVIVDLQEGVYRSFPKTHIGTFSVALWEKDKITQPNKQMKVDDIHAD